MFGKSPAKMTEQEKRAQIDQIYQKASASFPGVAEIEAGELKRRMEAGESFVLVDVREPTEQAVSMIPGALTVAQFEVQADQHKDATIVCYCTIGGRSGRMTQDLCARGFDAYNMPGAVLSWSHEGGQFADAEGATRRIHTYSAKFALVAEGYEAVH